MRLAAASPTMRRLCRVAKVARVALAVPGYGLSGNNPRYATWLREEVERAGCLAVKIGQWVSSRTDAFPPSLTEEFAKLRTDVAPMPPEDVRAIVSEDLGNAYFESFDETPVSTGSIAQVHRAVLADGGDVVAVKIRRPGLSDELEDDVTIIRRLMTPLQWANPKLYADLVDSLRDLVDTVRLELDFCLEAAHMRLFHGFFEATSSFRVPRVVGATERTIVMEYVASHGTPRSPSKLIELFYKMFFELGYLHTDLHAGNLGTTAAGDIVVYDFGSVLPCPRDLQTCIKHLMVAYLNKNTSVMLDYLLEYGILVGTTPGARLEADERAMLEDFLNSVIVYVEKTDLDEFTRVMKTIALPAETTVTFRADLVMVIRSFTLLEGLCKELDPGFVILDAVTPLVDEFTSDPLMYRLKIEDDLRTLGKLFES